MLSTTCCYGLQAMIFIAEESAENGMVELNKIASQKHIPRHFLSKILHQLVKQKLLKSMKGPNGGYVLGRAPEDISIMDIVKAIDGDDMFSKCGLYYQDCNPDKPCPIHVKFRQEMDSMEYIFLEKKLSDRSYLETIPQGCPQCVHIAGSDQHFNEPT